MGADFVESHVEKIQDKNLPSRAKGNKPNVIV